MPKTSILEALANVSEDDLIAIDEQIAAHEKKLAGLKLARNIVDVQLNGKKQRAKPQRRNGGGAGSTRDDADPNSIAARVHDLISEEGPLPVNVIAQRLGKSPQAIGVCCGKSGWFYKNNEGDYCIAKAG